MFDVTLNISIPFCIQNVEADNMFEAAENCRKLLNETLPLVISNNFERVKKEMVIELNDITEINNEKA